MSEVLPVGHPIVLELEAQVESLFHYCSTINHYRSVICVSVGGKMSQQHSVTQ